MPSKANPKPLSSSHSEDHDKKQGFVLVATLALVGLALATVILVTTLLRVRGDFIEVRTHQALARQQALVALDIAIGQLQETAGNDRVITAPAATLLDTDPSTLTPDGIVHPHWTRVFDLTTGRKTWLVSSVDGTPDPRRALDAEHSTVLVAMQTAGASDPGQWVRVEKIPTRTIPGKSASAAQTTGHYAYWVGELNTRAHAALRDEISSLIEDDEAWTYNQLSMPRRSAIEVLFPGIGSPENPDIHQQLHKLKTPEQLFYLQPNKAFLRAHYFDTTTQSRSVLSNPIEGGLKKNLSDPVYADPLITSIIRQQITSASYTTGTAHTYQVQGDDPAQVFSINETPAFEQPLALHQPVLTDFCLSMGIFHTQYDRRHRIRFHMHAEWLNPYPYPLAFNNSRAVIIIADHLPTLEITNETSGQSFTVDLNEFNSNYTYNYPNLSKIHSWFEFDELSSNTGTLRYGIDPGRIYRMSEPDKIAQPQGLARTIQQEPNRWVWGGESPPLIGPRPENTLYATDTIHIRSITPVQMNLTVVPIYDGGAIPRETHPDVYAAEKGWIMKINNIPFEAIDISMRGGTYSRSTSGSFAPPDYRLAFRFKLNESDPTLFETLGNEHSLRNPMLDLNDPSVRALFEIPDVAAAARSTDPLTEQEIFWDESERENSTTHNPEEYQFHLYDVPVREPLSCGVFSQLHFQGRPHPWVGSVNAASSAFNQVFDRYYFSGVPLKAKWDPSPRTWIADALPAGVMTHHAVRPLLQSDGQFPSVETITSANGAAFCLMEGGFNIFSPSPLAWRVFMENQFLNNAALSIQNRISDTGIASGVFSRLPYGAARIGNQLADSAITEDPRHRNIILYRQGIRAIDSNSLTGDEQMQALAQAITLAIRAEVSRSEGEGSGSSITSLRDLIAAGTFDHAIADAGINGLAVNGDAIDPLSPGFLRQADIFALLGARMTTRSDTFVIRCYGESNDARSGTPKALAYCEAVLQRFPEYIDPSEDASLPARSERNLLLGRRFRVVSFRWLQPQDL